MLKNLKFKYKIMLLPFLATAGFLTILLVNHFLGTKSEMLLTRIQTGYAPALELSRDLEETLQGIQRGLQDAVAADDIDTLTETDTLRDQFLRKVAGTKGDAFEAGESERLKMAFQEYYALARETTGRMIGGNTGERLIAVLEKMTTKYNGIRKTLESNTARDKAGMAAAFASARMHQRTSMTVSSIITISGIFLLGGLSAWVLRGVVKPLGEVSVGFSRMASGDLTNRIEITSRDEMGVLGNAFNETTQKLSDLISHVRETTSAITDVTQRVHQTSSDISKGIEKQRGAEKETSSSILEMSSSIKEVSSNVEILSVSTTQTSSSILEMDATIGEIATHMDSLSKGIDITSSSITEMATNSKEIAVSVETLQGITENTGSSLHELNASVRQIEENAQKNYALSEKTTQNAQKGRQSVHETITGMQEIKANFMELQEIISRLAAKSDSIGQIVQVIVEVAEQTDLLSLNAAIISAQAGVHGKGFAIVADEVKSLSERTAKSTHEIANLIKAVQNETSNAVKAMSNGSGLVQKGVALSNEAGKLLEVIMESSHLSAGMVTQIVKATKEQGKGVQEVDQAMVQIMDRVQQINRASHEQEKAGAEIMKAVENMRVLGQGVKRSTQEQSKGSKLITTAVERVMLMIRHILQATQEQKKGSEQITHALQIFTQGIEESALQAREMDNIVTTLSSHSKQLEQKIGRFKI